MLLSSCEKAYNFETSFLNYKHFIALQLNASSDTVIKSPRNELGELELDQVLHARAKVNEIVRTG